MLPAISGVNMFPQDDVPVATKRKKEWGTQAAMAVYQMLLQSNTYYNQNDWSDWITLRLYANGKQDILGYKKWYTGLTNNNTNIGAQRINTQGFDEFSPLGTGSRDIVRGARVFSPMDYSVVSPLPKIISTITSLVLNEANYKVQCKSLNPAHVQKKQEEAWSLYYRSTFGVAQAEVLKTQIPTDPLRPKNEAQVQLMLKLGYFRMLFESAFETLIQHSFDISKFDEWSQDVVQDGANIGFETGKRYRCDETGKTKVKYIDPTRFVIQYIKTHEGRKASYVGHIEEYPMYIIKQKMHDMGYSFEQIKEVAQQAYAQLNQQDASIFPSTLFLEKDSTGRWAWEALKIRVLEFEYVTYNELRYVKTDKGFQLIENPNHRYDKKDNVTTLYEGMYVLGTQVLIKWQEAENNDGTFSYFWSRIPGRSIADRCRPICDDFMKCIIKLRGELWAAAPSGYYVDLSSVGNLTLNPEDQQEFVQQCVAAHRQSGLMFGQTQFKNGRPITDKPIIPMANGPQNLEQYTSQLAYFNNLTLDIAGIPQILAATPTQSQDKAVRIGELEVISACHALFPQKLGFQKYKNFAAEVILNQIRMDIRFDVNGARKQYAGCLTPEQMEAVLAVKDLSMDELSITLKALPNLKQKQEIKAMLLESSRAGTRDGMVKLTESDLMYLFRLVDDDQVELAEMYASMVIDERLAAYDAKQQQSIAAQAEANTKSAADIEMMKQQTLELKNNLETMQKQQLLMLDKQTPSMEVAQKIEGDKEVTVLEGAMQAATGKDIDNPRK